MVDRLKGDYIPPELNLIVCTIDAEGATVSSSTDVPQLFKRMRQVDPRFLPVAAHEASEDLFRRVTGLGRLPTRISLTSAAGIFRRLGLDRSVVAPVTRQFDACPDAGGLFTEWQRACSSALEVAV